MAFCQAVSDRKLKYDKLRIISPTSPKKMWFTHFVFPSNFWCDFLRISKRSILSSLNYGKDIIKLWNQWIKLWFLKIPRPTRLMLKKVKMILKTVKNLRHNFYFFTDPFIFFYRKQKSYAREFWLWCFLELMGFWNFCCFPKFFFFGDFNKWMKNGSNQVKF